LECGQREKQIYLVKKGEYYGGGRGENFFKNSSLGE
jgi:hypothetical protein